MNPLFDRVTIAGAGLLGASLGLAMQARGLARHITGVGRRQSSLDQALARGTVHAVTLDLAAAAADADLIVVATPAGAVTGALDTIRHAADERAIVIDVASTKGSICAHARSLWSAPRRFIGCHPMAGSEKSGPEHATPHLYEGSVCLVETGPDLDVDARAQALRLWEAIGARVIGVDPDHHDALLARTSHVPHIIAAALALVAAREGATCDFIGNGFRDTTRIAAGSPEMWRDITLTNGPAIAGGLRAIQRQIDAFLDAVDRQDPDALLDLFNAGKSARESVLAE